MTNTEVSDKVYFVQGLRRSNAAVAIPSKVTRKERTRSGSRSAAINRSARGE
jgi:hypothetical protein